MTLPYSYSVCCSSCTLVSLSKIAWFWWILHACFRVALLAITNTLFAGNRLEPWWRCIQASL